MFNQWLRNVAADENLPFKNRMLVCAELHKYRRLMAVHYPTHYAREDTSPDRPEYCLLIPTLPQFIIEVDNDLGWLVDLCYRVGVTLDLQLAPVSTSLN